MNTKTKRMLASMLSGMMLMTGAAAVVPQNAAAAGDCVIDSSMTYQTIQGFGGINLPEWITQGDMTDAQVQKAFGNGPDELGFTILRIFVNDNSNAWKTAVPTAKRAQALGAKVFASPWNPPAAIRNEVNGGLNGGKYQLKKDKWAEYAQHLNSYIKYMEGQGIDLYSISVQNEPDYAAEWTYWSANDVASFIAQYGKAVKEGTNAKLMSAESFQYQKPIYNAILGNQQAMANCDLFGTHFYGTQRSQMDFPTLENSGKELWMTEVYVPNSDDNSADRFPEAIQVAENMHNGLVVANLNAYVWWYIRRQYGPMKEDGNISKRGYMMAQYSKWVRPGAVRIEATEQPNSNILCSAYQNEDGNIAVVAINKGSSAVTQNFVLSGGDISEVTAYRTSANENIKESSVSANGSSFSSQLPGNSVTTFVINGSGSTPGEPDEDGNLAHYRFEESTEGFTGRGDASVKTTTSEAYAGSKSLSCTGRTSAWNGATHTLNARMCNPGEEYSFSAIVKYTSGSAASDTYHFTLQYTDSAGETQYDKIATEVIPKGDWVQLANTNYKIPAGATDMSIYIETDTSTSDFFVDEVIIAPKGTVIDGPKAVMIKLGDLNGDEKITAADLSIAKNGMLKSFASDKIKNAADINGDGTVDKTDIGWYVDYLLGKTNAFLERVEPPKAEMRTITEYTAAVKDSIVMTEPQSSWDKKSGVTYPQITKEQYFSKKANKNKNYNIMLPANYDESKKYPVLYLLHGFFEDEDRMILTGNNPPIPTPQIIINAVAEGAAEEMIVVVPQVFTHPTKEGATGFGDYESSVGYDNFVDDIVDSLMPHIESKYSVATGRENTAVTGFSMGGREALRIGMKYPDKFAYIGAICPAPGVEGPWKWESEEAAPSLVLLTGGTNDDVVGLSTPQGYHDNFDKAGTPHIWHVVQGGYHGDNCIRAHIYNFVRVIFHA